MSLHSSLLSPDDSARSQIIASLSGVFFSLAHPSPACALPLALQLLPFMFPPSFQFARILPRHDFPFEPLRPQISPVPGGKRKGGKGAVVGWVGEEGRKGGGGGGGGGDGDRDGSMASCEARWRRSYRKHPGLQRWADRKEVKSFETELGRWPLLLLMSKMETKHLDVII